MVPALLRPQVGEVAGAVAGGQQLFPHSGPFFNEQDGRGFPPPSRLPGKAHRRRQSGRAAADHYGIVQGFHAHRAPAFPLWFLQYTKTCRI